MARTLVFLYVFTVPFVLLSDEDSGVIAHCFMVFVVTYGFVGLELVAIELDNPFGDDPNDFDHKYVIRRGAKLLAYIFEGLLYTILESSLWIISIAHVQRHGYDGVRRYLFNDPRR